HPRWIPPDDLAKVDARAGSTMGRIFRIRPKDTPPRPAIRLDKLDTLGLVAALDSPNGWQRDIASQMLIWRKDPSAVELLQELFQSSSRPEARLHALCLLDAFNCLPPFLVEQALEDSHSGVRRHGVRIAEKNPFVVAFANLADEPDPQVRLQLACSLGA